MKNLINLFTLLFMLTYGLSYGQNKLYIFDLSAESPISISCSDFMDSFEGMLTEKDLNRKKKKKIISMFSKLDTLNKQPYTDVRYKGNLLLKGKKYSFCGDSASILINNQFYSTSPELIVYFKKLSK